MDLTGTTWLLNAQPDTSVRITPSVGSGHLFISNGIYYGKMDIVSPTILYGHGTDDSVYDSSGTASFTGWRAEVYRIVAFVDEPETDKSAFETWLTNNAVPYTPPSGNYIVSGNDLGDIADAIRAKTGSSSDLEFPTGFINGIGSIGNAYADTYLVAVTKIDLAGGTSSSQGLYALRKSTSYNYFGFVNATSGYQHFAEVTFIPLMDIDMWVGSDTENKIVLMAGTEYIYQCRSDVYQGQPRYQTKIYEGTTLKLGSDSYFTGSSAYMRFTKATT